MAVTTEEIISGFRAVCLSQSGLARVAMASVSGRMPAIGVASGNAVSGASAVIYEIANFMQFTSGMADFSGYLGQNVFVGRSGQIVTASGSWNSGGLLSGDIIQAIGTIINSGAAGINVWAPYNSGPIVLQSGQVVSGMIGNNAVSSGNISPNAVGYQQIITAGVQTDHIASGAVVHFAIAALAIASGQVQAATVSSGHLASGQVSQFHHSSGSVISGHIGNAAVVSGSISSGSISPFHHSSGCVVSGQVGNAAVVSGSMASGSISPFHHSSGCVVSGQVGNAAVVSGSVASGSLCQFHHASGAILSGHVGNAAIVSGSYASGSIPQFAFSSGISAANSGIPYNLLANGGMWFCQRFTPTANSVITSGISGGDAYAADRWKVACNSGSMVLYQRWDQYTSGFASGISARFYGQWTFGGSGKFAITQPLETQDSAPLSMRTLTFQARIKLAQATSGLILQMGILQTNSGVAADTIPLSYVSGWALGTSGTNPTWGSGVNLVGTATTVIATSGIWNTFSVSTAMQSGHVCILPTIWANQPLASGAIIHITELGLYDG